MRLPAITRAAAAGFALFVLGACTSSTAASRTRAGTPIPTPTTSVTSASPSSAPPSRWTPAHIVVVIEENHSYQRIVGSPSAPYLNQLARQGASLSQMYGIRHPSQPNYLALFSGSTHGLTDDTCPHQYSGATLAGQLAAVHRRVVGYSEGLPHAGDLTCTAGSYARKHAPWTDFPALDAAAVGQPLTALPTDFTRLPDVSYVIPDLQHDMHDGTISQADTWLRDHLRAYVAWASAHDSLLIVTWDEDDYSQANRIPTIVVGSHVRHTVSSRRTNLYGLLRTIEWLYGQRGIGLARSQKPITDIWTA